MSTELRKTGISVVGDMPWGTHFCHFYETKQDLLDTLVPYFKAGLESKEYCLWVVSDFELITVEEAQGALAQAVPDLDRHLADGDIEILNGHDWYFEKNVLNLEKVMSAWDAKVQRALGRGYDGLRASADTFWLAEKDWKDFFAYEKQINDWITSQSMTVICTYPLAKSGAAEVLDVVESHQFATARRQGEWKVIETPELIQAKAEIKKLNEALEQRVIERTNELRVANDELRKEIAERKQAEALLYAKEQEFRAIVENAPDLIARYDRSFQRTYVNPAFAKALELPTEALINKPIFSSLWDAGADVKEDELAQIRQRCEDVFDTGKSCEFEVNVPMPTGTRYFSARFFPELDLNGSVINVLGIARDITERKQAEDALRRSEDHLRLVIDTIPVMAWSLRTDGVVDFLNQRWMDYSGVSLEQYVEEPTRPVHPADIPRVMEKWLADMVAGEPNEDEMRLRRADGEYRWFLVRNAPLRDEQGNVVKWYGASIDIQDRKQVEEALRQAEEKYHSIFEHAIEGIFQTTPDGHYITANPALARMLGYDSPEELLKHRTDIARQQYVETERRAEFKRLLEEQGVVRRFEYQAYRKDGHKIWLSDNVRAVRDESGAVLYYEGSTEDITERKQVEEQLRRAEEQARQVLDTIAQQIWSGPTDGTLDYCNYQWRAYTGLRLEELDGHGWQQMLHPDDQERVLTAWRESVATGKPYEQEERHRRFDGVYRWFLCRGLPLRNAEGRIERWYGTNTDIEDRKRAEERLRATTEQLRALSARLQSAREDEATRIAREIHDELGAALTSLRWELESLDKTLSDSESGSQLHVMRERIKDMMRLVDTTVSTIRRITQELRPSVLDDLGLAEAIEWQAQQFQTRTGIICHCDCSLEDVALSQEQSTAVFRIFQETLTNILRHAQATRVDIMMEEEDGEFVLTINDNGRGITEDQKSGQHSLGLLGMRERAHLIGGKIDITGVEGKGTVVTLRILISG
ncbi:MAG: hypothetical protein QOC96_2287 [Acidobacteriota bacterium]|jgi:PAS domain S-box-containing protein|nr:hypothetical protein [Acidobacteriota bacterium]